MIPLGELDRLCAEAQAEMPGPWWYDGRDILHHGKGTHVIRVVVPLPETWHEQQRVPEAVPHLIAACSPGTVAALTRAVRAAQAVENLVEAMDREQLFALAELRASLAPFVRGLLGWSNKRPGLEFYRWDEKIIPRHGSEWGDLLALEYEVAGHEGSPVLVAILPRSWSDAEIQAVEKALASAVSPPVPKEQR